MSDDRDRSGDAARNWQPGSPGRSGHPDQYRRRKRPGIAYVGCCIAATLILVASGFAWVGLRTLDGIASSDAIPSGPSTGAQNILLMGIESRRYWNGDILPPAILAKLHAGSAQAVANGVGGNDTNTLILIHIFADGRKAVGFSIPRDDWVQFAGTIGPQQSGKIDQAYGVSMFYREQQLSQTDPGISQDRLAALGNEAGQAAAVATVEKLTGVHVDHFAALNLYGFYEIAKVLGGVEVCLNHSVHDVNSGANFPAGYQHLDAAQALAFVRQRDGLPNGDLDRTHRQQAFLDSVMHQLRTDGVLSDLTKIQALLNAVRQYAVTDSGWNLLDFAAEARNLTSSRLVFYTLPIEGYATIDGQDANQVDPAYIQQIVRTAFYSGPARGRPKGSAARAAGQVRKLLAVRAGMPTATTGSVVSQQNPSPGPAIPTTGPQGSAVAAKNGIPCVN